jgi:hypothetical protein
MGIWSLKYSSKNAGTTATLLYIRVAVLPFSGRGALFAAFCRCAVSLLNN